MLRTLQCGGVSNPSLCVTFTIALHSSERLSAGEPLGLLITLSLTHSLSLWEAEEGGGARSSEKLC